MPNLNTARYTSREEYPYLENNNNHMAHCLTEDLYKRLRAKTTPSGFSIDDCIQTGVDNQGKRFASLRTNTIHC